MWRRYTKILTFDTTSLVNTKINPEAALTLHGLRIKHQTTNNINYFPHRNMTLPRPKAWMELQSVAERESELFGEVVIVLVSLSLVCVLKGYNNLFSS